MARKEHSLKVTTHAKHRKSTFPKRNHGHTTSSLLVIVTKRQIVGPPHLTNVIHRKKRHKIQHADFRKLHF